MENSLPAHCTLVNDVGRMYVPGSDTRPSSEPSQDTDKATDVNIQTVHNSSHVTSSAGGSQSIRESLQCWHRPLWKAGALVSH